MSLVSPELGLIFWMTLSFLIVLFILKKFAWKPILNMLKEREQSIEEALEQADRAKEKMAEIQADNEKIMQEARAEREKILQQAEQMSDNILAEAKQKAREESDKIMESAKNDIQKEKEAAVKEIKTQVVNISVDIAEKIIRKNLADDKAQTDYAKSLLKDTDLN